MHWYLLPGNVRVKILREIYQYNILNEASRILSLGPELACGNMHKKQPGCSLTKSTGYGYIYGGKQVRLIELRTIWLGHLSCLNHVP